MKPTKGGVEQVGHSIIQRTDRELYLMARVVSLEEIDGSVSALAFIVEVSVAICIG